MYKIFVRLPTFLNYFLFRTGVNHISSVWAEKANLKYNSMRCFQLTFVIGRMQRNPNFNCNESDTIINVAGSNNLVILSRLGFNELKQ